MDTTTITRKGKRAEDKTPLHKIVVVGNIRQDTLAARLLLFTQDKGEDTVLGRCHSPQE